MADVEQAKKRAATRAVQEVEDGMILGLGSGSTAAHAIRALGERIDTGLDIRGVPTSHQSAHLARDVGVPVRCLEDVPAIDLALDGADQVSGMDLIKGGGGAHAREKVVDTAADRFVALVDDSKSVDRLHLPVPVEILPDTRPLVEDGIFALGAEPTLRTAGTDAPALTDNGNLLLDCDFGEIADPGALGRDVAGIPGVVEHGLFHDLVDAIYIGTETGVDRRER